MEELAALVEMAAQVLEQALVHQWGRGESMVVAELRLKEVMEHFLLLSTEMTVEMDREGETQLMLVMSILWELLLLIHMEELLVLLV